MNIKKLRICLASCVFITPLSAVTAKDNGNAVVNVKEVMTKDFKDETDKVSWKSVNDGVMGGLSKGKIFATEAGNYMFTGDISLRNLGGFASVRTTGGNYDLSEQDGVKVRVRGDGRKYYFTSRSTTNQRLAFWYPIQTEAGKWMDFTIPFSGFYATFRGDKIKDVKLDPKNISSFGIMLYDKKDGEFKIELESIKAYKK